MDQNTFFRKATLRICGNLKIEEAMFSTFKFLRRTLPIDWMAIEYLDGAMNKMRTIAIVDSNGGKSVDLMTRLSDHARNQAEQKYRTGERKVYLFEHPEGERLAREMLEFHGVRATSLMVVALESGGRRIGTWVLASKGENRFSV